MRAITITRPGDASVLQIKEYPDPKVTSFDVLIEVMAAGINRADVAQRQGNYPAPEGAPHDVPGLEVAGTVIACGDGVTQWKVGDRVCALLSGGGYAERVAVKEGQCLPVPPNFSFTQAASLPEAIFTVWSNVFRRAGLKPGQNFLVHGGSSGIGITAIQLAKAFGASVFATAGSVKKVRACLELGADFVIDYKSQDFEQEFKSYGMDVVLDMVGGEYLQKNINIMRSEGCIVYINSSHGNTPQLNISQLMAKRLRITGSTLRGREYEFKKTLAGDILETVWPLLESAAFSPVIFKTFPFEHADQAHRLMESSEHIGKIILVR